MRLAAQTVRLALASLATAFISGCSYFPNFDGPFAVGTSPQYIPVDEIKSQIRCELRRFLIASHDKFEEGGIREQLDPLKNAVIQLTVQLDSAAGLTYFGIDLSFLSLEKVVALVSGRPGIFAAGRVRGTVTTKVDIHIPQSLRYVEPLPERPGKGKLAKASVARLPDGPTDPAVDAGCDPAINGSLIRLGIDTWLESFFKERAEKADADKKADKAQAAYCIPKITFTSQFVIFVNLSASLHPAGTTKLLAPVNLFVADFSPTHMHQLNVVLSLTDKVNPSLCKAGSGS